MNIGTEERCYIHLEGVAIIYYYLPFQLGTEGRSQKAQPNGLNK